MLVDELLSQEWKTEDMLGPIEAQNPVDPYAPAEEMLRAANETAGTTGEEYFRQRMGNYNKLLGDYLNTGLHLYSPSIPQGEHETLRTLLRRSQKFKLTQKFTDATLDKLATPQTAEKMRDFFALPHDPMWMEFTLKSLPGKVGVLLHGYDGETLRMYVVMTGKPPERDHVFIGLTKVRPRSLIIREGETHVEIEVLYGQDAGDTGWGWATAALVVDFILRINSPAVVEVSEAADMSRLNRKREAGGKLPLYAYKTVDISKSIREYIRETGDDLDGGAGVRLHNRRGHYKLLKARVRVPGYYWWNPHKAGRKELGEIEHDYAVDIQ